MRFPLLSIIAGLATVLHVQALNIQLDFTYDQQNGNFFGTHQTARNALIAAANDINAAIQSSLAAVPQDAFTGTSGTSTASIDWSLGFTNPSTGAEVTLETFAFAADTVRIYVGMRKLTGSTLGEGGPGSAGLQLGVGGSSAQRNAALDAAEAASDAVMTRGEGPVIGRLSGSFQGGYSVSYGALLGNLWFDNDTNNDNVVDSDTRLNSYWHFDATTLPAAGKNDFYSVALHELLHSIGFGASDTWTSLRAGTTWLGPEAIAENGGSGANLVATSGHLRNGYMSQRLSDGVPQESAMTPSITTGTRKYLTEMDAAILRDLGYAAVPEPSAAVLFLAGVILFARPRRR